MPVHWPKPRKSVLRHGIGISLCPSFESVRRCHNCGFCRWIEADQARRVSVVAGVLRALGPSAQSSRQSLRRLASTAEDFITEGFGILSEPMAELYVVFGFLVWSL